MADQKDTIYIDIDDEITSIIEKVRGSEHKILALVLPKRTTTLQSIVNMKLLKRTADEGKKRIVLITSEAGLLPLAGAVGLHVAKTLQSKPAIPAPPDMSNAEESVTDSEVASDEPELDDSKSIGELAGLTDEPEAASTLSAAEETIDIDNSDSDESGKSGGKKSKDKIKIPDFNKFRLRLILGGLVFVGLIVAWYFMFRVMPAVTVTIQTNNQSINDSPTITANTAVKTLDLSNNVIPAVIKDVKITATQKATATGKKNVGNKASGTVTLSLDDCSKSQVTIPAGSGVTSNGLTFITQSEAAMSSVVVGNQCRNSDFPSFSKATINVIAQTGGANYNVDALSYAVSGYSNVSGQGSKMSGGTDNIVTILSQSDIDGAKQKIASNTTQTQNDLSKAIKTIGNLPLIATLVGDDPSVSTSANAGDQVSDVTVTVVTMYHMLGVKQSDLEKIINNDLKSQIDSKKQAISDYGLGGATFTLTTKKSTTEQVLSLKTTVTTGAQIDTVALKKQIVGKKKGDIKTLVGSLPSVQTVEVDYTPFWITTTPHKISKITIVIQKSVTTKNDKPNQ